MSDRDPNDNNDDFDGEASSAEETLEHHEAPFRPANNGLKTCETFPRAPSYIHQQLRGHPAAFAANDQRVFALVKFGTPIGGRRPGMQIVDERSVGLLISQCEGVMAYAIDIARAVARKLGRHDGRHGDQGDVLQEAVVKYLDGSRTYLQTKFESDLKSPNPSRAVAQSLFGVPYLGVISGVDSQNRERFLKNDALANTIVNRDEENPIELPGESLDIDDVISGLTEVALPLIHKLIARAVTNNGFGKYRAFALEVFRLHCGAIPVNAKLVAERLEVSEGFVYNMAKVGHDPKTDKPEYVLGQIMKFAAGSDELAQLLALSPVDLHDRYKHLGSGALLSSLSRSVPRLDKTSDDDGTDAVFDPR